MHFVGLSQVFGGRLVRVNLPIAAGGRGRGSARRPSVTGHDGANMAVRNLDIDAGAGWQCRDRADGASRGIANERVASSEHALVAER